MLKFSGLHHLYGVVYPLPSVAWRWSDCPVVCSAAMLSLHFASSSATSKGVRPQFHAGMTTLCVCVCN